MNKCKVIGCNDKLYCKGLCQRHYRQNQRGALKDPTIDSLLEELKKYESLIHYQAMNVKLDKYKELFILLESIIKY